MIETEFRKDMSTAILTLENDRHNTLNIKTLKKLYKQLSSLPEHIGQIAVFSNHEKFFIPGADLKEIADLDPLKAYKFSRLGQRLFETFREIPQLIISAVDGYCMGGGMDFILASDIVIASETAVFSHPGARHGIITGFGGNWLLPEKSGAGRAFELFVNCEEIEARDAKKKNIVDIIVESDDLREVTLNLAENLSGQNDFLSDLKELYRRNLSVRNSLRLEEIKAECR